MVASRLFLAPPAVMATGAHSTVMPTKAPGGDQEALACYRNPYNSCCEYGGTANGFDASAGGSLCPSPRWDHEYACRLVLSVAGRLHTQGLPLWDGVL